jgi:hypothetical protein
MSRYASTTAYARRRPLWPASLLSCLPCSTKALSISIVTVLNASLQCWRLQRRVPLLHWPVHSRGPMSQRKSRNDCEGEWVCAVDSTPTQGHALCYLWQHRTSWAKRRKRRRTCCCVGFGSDLDAGTPFLLLYPQKSSFICGLHTSSVGSAFAPIWFVSLKRAFASMIASLHCASQRIIL